MIYMKKKKKEEKNLIRFFLRVRSYVCLTKIKISFHRTFSFFNFNWPYLSFFNINKCRMKYKACNHIRTDPDPFFLPDQVFSDWQFSFDKIDVKNYDMHMIMSIKICLSSCHIICRYFFIIFLSSRNYWKLFYLFSVIWSQQVSDNRTEYTAKLAKIMDNLAKIMDNLAKIVDNLAKIMDNSVKITAKTDRFTVKMLIWMAKAVKMATVRRMAKRLCSQLRPFNLFTTRRIYTQGAA